MKATMLILITGLWVYSANSQNILFDFDTAPLRASLPLSLSAGGVTANFSATGQGFSIQSVSTAAIVPVGFSGQFIYPSSIYAADLLVSFSDSLNDFSVLYAPEEYACDSSATMRVTAYLNGVEVGTATTNAFTPGTWPVETLRITTTQPFNSVVVHYDAAPVTGGDWGPIFMVDNMRISVAPPPIVLQSPVLLPDGTVQLNFTNSPAAAFSVWATANASAPMASWTLLGASTEVSPGNYQFIDLLAPGNSQRFYCVSSP